MYFEEWGHRWLIFKFQKTITFSNMSLPVVIIYELNASQGRSFDKVDNTLSGKGPNKKEVVLTPRLNNRNYKIKITGSLGSFKI